MFNPQVHYRSLFSLERSKASKSPNIYQTTIDHVGRWLYYHQLVKPFAQDIFRPWLYQGGQMPSTNESIWAEVRTEAYDTESRVAQEWVMRLEHSDSNYRMRKWRIDIALSCRGIDNADFCISVTWFLGKNYFGETPPIPPSSVPRLVTNILSDDMINCSIGGRRITSVANHVNPGDGREMFRFIISKARIVPVILVHLANYENLINPDGLQKILLGSAIVYWYDDPDVHNEITYEWARLNERYQCRADAIRVYLPVLNVHNEYDHRRHRYFPLSQYVDNSEVLINILSQSVFRISSRNIADHLITNFETLYIFQQKARLLKLREAAGSAPRSVEEAEYIAALEDENVKLTSKTKVLQEALDDESENSVLLTLENEELSDRFTKLQEQYVHIGKLEGQYQQILVSKTDVLSCVQTLPTNLEEALQLISKLFNHRIHVLDAAFESAADAKFSNLSEAYKLLYAIGTKLYDLYFIEGCKDIEAAFKQTGFEVALKESSMTNNDSALMSLRKRTYNNKEYTFSAHAKLDKSNANLRIHFIPDRDKRLIVIGHCGDHLKTAGTARRKDG